MRTTTALSCLVVAALLLTACGSSSSATSTKTVAAPAAPTAPAAPAAPTAPAAPATPTAPTAPTAASSSSSNPDGVPTYKPSTVVSQAPHSLIIASPESVSKVSAYYSSAFSGGGWVIVSKTVTPYSGSFTVSKNGGGATVVVSPKGSGSTIAISSH
jgi:hypothetical protein